MDDATRRSDETPHAETSARLTALVGAVTHAVLEVVESEAFPIAEQLRVEGHDPFSVIELVAVTLRALADGLEQPSEDWLHGR